MTDAITNTLAGIVANPQLHQRWLATVSHLESVGARKIARYQPATNASLELLQHAAEEARHAYFFRNLIGHLGCDPSEPVQLLGGGSGRRYLHILDLKISRFLRQTQQLSGRLLEHASYVLTTYGIETRAARIYPIYAQLLKQHGFKFSLRSIVAEEDAHLRSISAQIRAQFPDQRVVDAVLDLEGASFTDFWTRVSAEVRTTSLLHPQTRLSASQPFCPQSTRSESLDRSPM